MPPRATDERRTRRPREWAQPPMAPASIADPAWWRHNPARQPDLIPPERTRHAPRPLDRAPPLPPRRARPRPVRHGRHRHRGPQPAARGPLAANSEVRDGARGLRLRSGDGELPRSTSPPWPPTLWTCHGLQSTLTTPRRLDIKRRRRRCSSPASWPSWSSWPRSCCSERARPGEWGPLPMGSRRPGP